MIDFLCYAGAAACMIVVVVLAWDLWGDLWWQLKRWLYNAEHHSLAALWARQRTDRRAAERKLELAWLEHIDEQWNTLRMAGRTPLWTDVFGWIEDASVCPCGYVKECAIWCGDGSCHPAPAGQPATAWPHYPAVGLTVAEVNESMQALAPLLASGEFVLKPGRTVGR